MEDEYEDPDNIETLEEEYEEEIDHTLEPEKEIDSGKPYKLSSR